MALYHFKAVSQNGEMQEGRLEGSDQQAIVLQLQQRGLIPLSVELAHRRIGPPRPCLPLPFSLRLPRRSLQYKAARAHNRVSGNGLPP